MNKQLVPLVLHIDVGQRKIQTYVFCLGLNAFLDILHGVTVFLKGFGTLGIGCLVPGTPALNFSQYRSPSVDRNDCLDTVR